MTAAGSGSQAPLERRSTHSIAPCAGVAGSFMHCKPKTRRNDPRLVHTRAPECAQELARRFSLGRVTSCYAAARMRRSVFAPRLAVFLCVTGAGAWSACSGDNRDFFGDIRPSAGRFGSAGTSGAGAGTSGGTSTGGASAGSTGQGGANGGLGGSGGEATAGDTSSCGASGEAGESGAGGRPPDGDAGEANGGAGISGGASEAGAPSQAGGGGDPAGGESGSGGGDPAGGRSGSGASGGNDPAGGTSGTSGGGGFANHGGASGSGGIDPGGGSGGVQAATCQDNGDCQSDAEYCKKPACESGVGVCAPRPAACTGADAVLAPVCGCDAMTYFSACVAARDGVNVASPGECNTEIAAACTRAAGGDSCRPRRALARCYRPRASCDQPSPTTGTCWVLPDECPAAEAADAYYCGGPSGSTGCFGVCALLEREDSMVRDSAECK
jgi:hypothetical protein